MNKKNHTLQNIVLIVGISLGVVGSISGRGGQEQPSTITKSPDLITIFDAAAPADESTSKALLAIDIKKVLSHTGNLSIEITLPYEKNVKGVIFHDVISGTYYSPTITNPDDQVMMEILSIQHEAKEPRTVFEAADVKPLFDRVTNKKEIRISSDFSYQVQDSELYTGTVTEAFPDEALLSGRTLIATGYSLDTSDTPSETTLTRKGSIELLILKTDGSAKKLQLVYSYDFFEDELLLLNSLDFSQAPLAEKVLAIMCHYYAYGSDKYEERVRQAYNWLTVHHPGSETITEDQVASLSPSLFRTYISRIKYSLSTALPSQTSGGSTTVDFTSDTFHSIYGQKRNPYLDYYLTLSMKSAKPLFLSKNITELHPFDHTQFETLTEVEGRELAQKTLMYLTSGVEYTLPSELGTSGYLPVQDVYNEYTDLISTWVSQNGAPEDNYAPHAFHKVQYNSESSSHEPQPYSQRWRNLPVYAHNNYVGFTCPVPKNVLRISRLELLSSPNIVWDQTTTAVPFYAGSPQKAGKLADGRLSSYVQSLTPVIGPQKYGYTFSSPVQIGGLILYTGISQPVTASASFSIEVTTTDGQTITVVPQHLRSTAAEPGYRLEYAFVPNHTTNKIREYQTIEYTQTPAKPFLGDHNRTLRDYLQHVIISFTKPVEQIEKITLIHDLGSAADYEIEELMVFPQDPVGWWSAPTEWNNGHTYAKMSVAINGSGIWKRNGIAIPATDFQSPQFNSASHLLGNADPDTYYEVGVEGDALQLVVTLPGGSMVPIRNMIVWESDNTSSTGSQFGAPLLAFGSDYYSAYEEAAVTMGPYRTDLLSTGSIQLETPFYEKDFLFTKKLQIGNPLPFALSGIDTPRTFNYKLHEQTKARKLLRDTFPFRFSEQQTTRALDRVGKEHYSFSYASQKDMTGVSPVSKPFLPGSMGNQESALNDLSSERAADKVAGVDSPGMLLGALAMTGFRDTIVDSMNTQPAVTADTYYAMNKATHVPGLSYDTGTPVYQAEPGNSYLDGKMRLTHEDIERMSVLVPDLYYIQPGDIVVSNIAGSLEVGIIVSVNDKPTQPGEDPDEYLDDIVVATVKRTYGRVSLGTWGSTAELFGGFTQTPEKYQLRRLIKLKAPYSSYIAEVESTPISQLLPPWEPEVKPYRIYTTFPSGKAPVRHTEIFISDESGIKESVGYDIENDEFINPDEDKDIYELMKSYSPKDYIGTGVVKSIPDVIETYFKELPPTQYYNQKFPNLFQDTTEAIPPNMVLTSVTGWRFINGSTRYHLGADLVSADGSKDIYAPTDGLLYYIQPSRYIGVEFGNIAETVKTSIHLRLPDMNPNDSIPGDILNVQQPSYSDLIYGISMVFITNKEDIRNGRVIVISHMGKTYEDGTSDSSLGIVDWGGSFTEYKSISQGPLKTAFEEHHLEEDFPLLFVESKDTGKVLDLTISNGLEVSQGEWIGRYAGRPTYGEHVHIEVWEYFPDGVSGVGRVNEENLPSRWFRVSPLTIFDGAEYSSSFPINFVEKAFMDIEQKSETEILQVLLPWTGTGLFWEREGY